MKTTYYGGIRECLANINTPEIDAHTFLFYIGEHLISIRPENSSCRLCFDVSVICQMEQFLSEVKIRVSNLLMELTEKQGIAQLELEFFARTDEDDNFIKSIRYSQIPFQLIQHRAIVPPAQPQLVSIHPNIAEEFVILA